MATTAMRLVRTLGSNPGLSSFLGQPWARGLNAVGVDKAKTRRRETSAFPLGDLASLREATPCLLRVFASSRLRVRFRRWEPAVSVAPLGLGILPDTGPTAHALSLIHIVTLTLPEQNGVRVSRRLGSVCRSLCGWTLAGRLHRRPTPGLNSRAYAQAFL